MEKPGGLQSIGSQSQTQLKRLSMLAPRLFLLFLSGQFSLLSAYSTLCFPLSQHLLLHWINHLGY